MKALILLMVGLMWRMYLARTMLSCTVLSSLRPSLDPLSLSDLTLDHLGSIYHGTTVIF